MWNINLTKADKRHCRELIHIGLERECKKFVKDMQSLTYDPITLAENQPYREENGRAVEGPWHKRYIEIFKAVDSFDNYIADRYDGMTGSHYIDGVICLYCDGIITDEEIAVLSDEPREFIIRFKNTMR